MWKLGHRSCMLNDVLSTFWDMPRRGRSRGKATREPPDSLRWRRVAKPPPKKALAGEDRTTREPPGNGRSVLVSSHGVHSQTSCFWSTSDRLVFDGIREMRLSPRFPSTRTVLHGLAYRSICASSIRKQWHSTRSFASCTGRSPHASRRSLEQFVAELGYLRPNDVRPSGLRRTGTSRHVGQRARDTDIANHDWRRDRE
ncbi:hypothetical protein SAMN05444171_5033 [Bradyrhizobium lablabi]|uniref:Uncharacterized protein n=1 Tax=Bradyrhizobium lablabi TaxID=722472 RepID=A0A1H5D8C1_9BRAD|nr:hypothetical protein SAMN05444171_5033 [Bradyrhizobium lablabi]